MYRGFYINVMTFLQPFYPFIIEWLVLDLVYTAKITANVELDFCYNTGNFHGSR